MKRHPWQTCCYYADEGCPNRSLIGRAYLIPQLLSRSELAAIKTACADCEVCRQNRRKHRRVQRPLEAVILDKQSGQELHGTTLDVSDRGALIEVGDCNPFQVNREIQLRLCDASGCYQASRALIKRVEHARGAISVFLLNRRWRRGKGSASGPLSRGSTMGTTWGILSWSLSLY
jgi:hypothetical protein